MSFEVTIVTTMDSQEPTYYDDGHLLASHKLLPILICAN